ncbi:MAG: bifunctional glutamate N-acetyltransferase/amino-acid acetyltransferase ArgJ [Actinomycetaceae bacterium]|nr:bifunctional glutamate N-acetyltransferase/amino-acid acetyltransferase ArgJ [Actinomycetaceae bacterium]
MRERKGVCFPRGFQASAAAAGLKTSGAVDVALVANHGERPTSAAVFTSNRVVAAPVAYSQKVMRDRSVTHVVLNSGNANACTGQRGYSDVLKTVQAVGQACGIDPEAVAVCSTGVIGEYLAIDALTDVIPSLSKALSSDSGESAARAIMTTDTVPKTVEYDFDTWRIGGMAKGAGMLAPALATMLCVVTTDAVIDQRVLQRALTHAVENSFNRLDTDGCQSTNDTVIVLASGESGTTVDEADFTRELTLACTDLARKLCDDAEGASHTIDIHVTQASSKEAALAVARAVSRSALVKTAIFGNDPNWGRILSQIGTVDSQVAPFSVDAIDVSINGVTICRGGGIGEPKEKVDLASNRHVDITVRLGAGNSDATIYTTDLTHDYVHENSAYTT